MRMKTSLIYSLAMFLVLSGTGSAGRSQTKRTSASLPEFDILNYDIAAELTPDAHEIKTRSMIRFKTAASTDFVVFELSENISVQRVLNAAGTEIEFGQDEIGPGYLTVRFPRTIDSGEEVTLVIECQGGFDKDRFSRMYTRDENSAYIGMEGTYLLPAAKWIPIGKLFADRATGTLEVTVPLGMTVIGPGTQLPVVTKGIVEKFIWKASTPILPGSFVAGQYFQKRIQSGRFRIECFAKEPAMGSMEKSAETVARILEYYTQAYGEASSGDTFRLVEVDDLLVRQHGMLGTIFITRRELAQSNPPIRELARRVASQWWQETVGVQKAEDLWLEDGMAYYAAAQYLAAARGAGALKEEIDNLAVLALKFESKSAVRAGWELGYRSDKYESVVAGKGAWVLNMLRGLMTDAGFNEMVRQYFRKYSGIGGTTPAFQKLAEAQLGKELGWFFTEWLDSTGVPELRSDYVVFKTAKGFRGSGSVNQDRVLFRMPVQIAVVGGGREERQTIDLIGRSASFDIYTLVQPEKVLVDPENNLLRDSRELQTSVQLTLGDDHKQAGNFVDAIRAYEAALKLSPQRSLAHFRLAETFYEQFNLQSAANSFRDALNGDRDPKWIEVWCYIYLGKIYDILGQRQRAMAEYTKAVNTKDDTFGAQA